MGFKTRQDYGVFSSSVRSSRRFFHETPAAGFLVAVIETSGERTTLLPTGARLWRAQLGYCNELIEDEQDCHQNRRSAIFSNTNEAPSEFTPAGRPN